MHIKITKFFNFGQNTITTNITLDTQKPRTKEIHYTFSHHNSYTNRFGYNRGQGGRRRYALLKIASYSTVHSTQQWMEMSKSITLEIDFGPMVITRKQVTWQQFHSLIHLTTHFMVTWWWFFSPFSFFFLCPFHVMDQCIGMCLVVYCTNVSSVVFSTHLFLVVLFVPLSYFRWFRSLW